MKYVLPGFPSLIFSVINESAASKIIIVNIPPVVSTRQGISCLCYCGEVSSLPRKVGEHCRVERQGQWEDRWGIVNSQAELRILTETSR